MRLISVSPYLLQQGPGMQQSLDEDWSERAIVHLLERNEVLYKTALDAIQRSPTPVIIAKGFIE